MRTAFNIAAEASNGMLYYFVYIAIEPLGPTKPSLNTRQSRRNYSDTNPIMFQHPNQNDITTTRRTHQAAPS